MQQVRMLAVLERTRASRLAAALSPLATVAISSLALAQAAFAGNVQPISGASARSASTKGVQAPVGSDTRAAPAAAGEGVLSSSDSSASSPGNHGEVTALQTVVVTGTKIAIPDYVSPSPLVSTTVQTLQSTGQVSVENALEQAPQFTPAFDDSYNAQANGGGGIATVSLRGLGSQRTLVLLDGRRIVPSDGLMDVDMNDIPMGIISSVDVITGGASAVYGSDAVAGVVNIKTLRNFSGAKFQATYGSTFLGSAEKSDYSATFGTSFAGGRGSILESLEFTKRGALADSANSFYAASGPSGTLFYGSYEPSAGNLATQAAINSVFSQYGTPPGAVHPSQQLYVNTDGTLFTGVVPLQDYKGPTGAAAGYTTATGSLIYDTSRDAFLITPENRYTSFTNAKYDLTDSIQAYSQFLYVHNKDSTRIGWNAVYPGTATAAGLEIPVTNPYVPAGLAQILASRPDPTAPFTYDGRLQSLGYRRWDETFNTLQATIGATGALDSIDGTWDVYYSRGLMGQDEVRENYTALSALQKLVDAPDGGSSICAGGFNPFAGPGASLSQACKAYSLADTNTLTDIEQDDVEASVQGRVLRLPAGRVRFSAGADYRSDGYSYKPDYLITSTTSTTATQGSTSVWELSGELYVPLMRHVPLVDSANADLGYRYSDYRLSGGVSTYKATLNWRMFRPIMFRGGFNRAVRAPNPYELFASQSAGIEQLGSAPAAGDPCDVRSSVRNGANAAQIAALCAATGLPSSLTSSYEFNAGSTGTITSGNTRLKPEVANTYTIGLVYTPSVDTLFLHRVNASVDYYSIDLKDAIQTISGLTALDKCYSLDGSNPTYSASDPYCSLISRDMNTGAPTLDQPYLNLGGYKTSGIDLEFDDTVTSGDDHGSVHFSTVLSYLNHFLISELPGAPYVEYAGTVSPLGVSTSPLPRFRAVSSLNYSIRRYSVGLRWRFVSSANDVNRISEAPTVHDPAAPHANYFDLNWSASFGAHYDISATVTNVTNHGPVAFGTAGGVNGTNTGLYDPLGRAYTVSLTARF